MKNKGFTLVELLAVIAILALLVIIALPNVLKMFNQAKKDTFLTEAKNIYKEISKKYISETMKGNKINNISNTNNKLDLESNNLKYNVKLNNDGSIKEFEVSNGTYCLSGKFNNLSELTTDKITEGKCEGTSPKNFSTDDWKIIIDAIKEGNDGVYNVGDTKEIDLGSYGKHTLRIANKSTPSECSNTNFSQSACGFVLEFADVITTHNMNPSGTYKGTQYNYGWNIDGWPASSMYTFVNNDIYNAIPSEIKNAIIDTTVVSGHGSKDTANFTSTDKLYLLAPKEIYTDWSKSYDTAKDLTRTLDYYTSIGVTTSSYSGAIKKNGTNASIWWLRSAKSITNNYFYIVDSGGDWSNISANITYGVSVAFRMG
ncbi:MAG: type II secretion system GspH family protein [Clostridium sp.]|nr:type II secretion system GspH family protein [Clostridium sp.]